MLFNSIEYLLFLPAVFIFYWFVFNKSLKSQNTLILCASYLFYGWWDWRFLSLIFLSSIVDYFSGIKIYNSKNNEIRKIILLVSICFNIGLLGFFKYYNFFIDSWIELVSSLGYNINSIWTLDIILPVGISFYTFQTMSYSIDVFNEKIKPTKDFISFASFVAFFPQLVAGPIERASNLLPQILVTRNFNYVQAVEGLRLILWGLFKKVVIADSLAYYVNNVFMDYHLYDGGTLLLVLIYFSFQIYCDFSGYSDIAIGTSKLLGFELMSNFKFPYFSRDIGEFWRRWHISLSSWFKDYVYIPLGGSKKGIILSIRNIFIIFLVSGFWHGSNWTFIAWGFIHASFYLPLFISGKNRRYTSEVVAEYKLFPSFKELYQMITTFALASFAWIFFRSESLSDSINYLYIILSDFSFPTTYRFGIIYIFILITLDWMWRFDERNPLNINNKFIRWIVYFILANAILFSGGSDNIEFIYFQF